MRVVRRLPGAFLFVLICVSLNAAVFSGFTPEELAAARLLVVLAVAVTAFALTRTRVGTAALGLLGAIVCAGAYFLQFPIPLWSLLLFAGSALGLYLWRCVGRTEKSTDAGGLSPISAFFQIALASVLSLALALGCYWGVIRPLSPRTRELKLITELRSMELFQVLGVSRTEIILDTNPELAAEEPPQEQEQGELPGEEESEAIDDRQESESDPEAQDAGADSAGTEEAEAIRYPLPVSRALWLLLLIPLLIATGIGVHALRKRRWERAVRALPAEDAVVNYYRCFLSLLGRAGLRRTGRQTLAEFTALYADRLPAYVPGGSDFAALTEVYERAFYGRGTVTPGERADFERAYAQFPAALRRQMGTARYALSALHRK